MKKFLALILALALLTTSAAAFGTGTGAALYTNQWTLAEGLTYRNDISRAASGSRVETFTLETAPGGEVYPIVMACDTIYGGLTVSRMISYAEGLGYNVVGAVNADFGFWDSRVPCGMVVENGVYKSSPDGNNAIAFANGTAAAYYMPSVDITITSDETGESVKTGRLNKTRADDGLYLYSEYFSTVSTRTAGEGWFVRFEVEDGAELSLSGTVSLTVTELITDRSAVPIGEGNILLTASAASGLGAVFESFKVGDTYTLTTACSDESLAKAPWVSGCGNYIVKDGAVFSEEYWDRAVTAANPRTAIGVKADGSVVYYVMDGRSSASAGATMKQLALDMISMGCVQAVNMDGGGSSVMALRTPGREGFTIVNSPSDGAPRAVCSYILFVTDNKPGEAKRLFSMQDGAFVLAGSSIDLTYAATDAALRTKPAVNVTARASRGRIVGSKYRAPATAGVDIITLTSGSIRGEAAIHVIDRADALTVADAETGKAVAEVKLDSGGSLSLAVSAKYLLRDVYMDASAPSYSVTGGVGEVRDGVFTASDSPGAEGKISVSAAGLKKEIALSIAFEFPDMLSHWARPFVKTLYDAGAVEGTSPTTFSPDQGMRRGDFVLLLWRCAGRPSPAFPESFADVPQDAYYAEAVAWAKEKGIAEGDNGSFDPMGVLNREQGFTLLYRALPVLSVEYPEADPSALNSFSDSAQISDWALTPAATLIKMGIVEGDAGRISPKAPLTRAQMCKLLCLSVNM